MHIVDPGTIQGISNETIMSYHLMKGMVAQPDIIPQVATIFENESTIFSSFLAKKGLTTRGLFAGVDNDSWKTVGNRKVMMAVKGLNKRKGRIISYECANTAKPGYNGEVVTLYLDIDWFSPYDVLELADNRTLLTVVDDMLPENTNSGEWRYFVKLNRTSKDEYINPTLLAEGNEIGFAYTNFYEMSETAYEKYTFDSWAWTHLTIQRMKHSISGTAEAMKTAKYWLKHGDQISWVSKQEMEMLQRWSEAREYQLIFGKGTVDINDYVLLQDMKNRDIVSGSGIINSGSGALRFPYSGKLTKKFLDNIMASMKIFADDNGVLELLYITGMQGYRQFQDLMGSLNIRPYVVVMGSEASKTVNADYESYTYGGVRIIPKWVKFFDNPARPRTYYVDGYPAESYRGIFVSLGNADIGTKNIQLVQLGDRGFKSGTINGINKGGESMQTSVDGSHRHILTESGIIVANLFGVSEIYVPFK